MVTLDGFRTAESRWLGLLAIALLSFGALALSIAWLAALRDGEIPRQWGEYQGNHGPWRYYHPGKELVWAAIEAPFCALIVATVALLARPSTKGAVLMGICLLSLLLVTSTHFWLVD